MPRKHTHQCYKVVYAGFIHAFSGQEFVIDHVNKYIRGMPILKAAPTQTVGFIHLILEELHAHLLNWLYLVLVGSTEQGVDIVAVHRDPEMKC